MNKKMPWIFSGLSLIAIFYLIVLLLNVGSASDDAWSEVKRLRERSNLALSIVRSDWLGKNKANVLNLSRDRKRQGVIVGVEGNNFKIGDFIFETNGDAVTNVKYID